MNYSELLPILILFFNLVASVVLIIPLLPSKRKIDDDLIVSVDKKTGTYKQKKHLKEQKNNIIALIFIVLASVLTIYTQITNKSEDKERSEVFDIGSETVPVKSEEEVKIDQLNEITQLLISGIENKDWEVLYESRPDSYKREVTKDNFSKHYSFDSKYSVKPTNPTVTVKDDLGFVYFDIIECNNEACSDSDKYTLHVLREYIFENGSWLQYEREPSKEALDCSAAVYMIVGADKFIDRFGGGSESGSYSTKLCATTLDILPEQLALCKAFVDKYKAEANRPVVNYEPPDIKYNAPTYQDNSLRCTSNTIGSYTYTNCH